MRASLRNVALLPAAATLATIHVTRHDDADAVRPHHRRRTLAASYIQHLESRMLPTRCDASITKVSSEDSKKLPTYTRAEVAKHKSAADGGIWVTYKDGVYDITDFVANHPGGSDKIILAAGQAIDPFWRIYQTHMKSSYAMEQLEKMRVGKLDASEPAVQIDTSDPYSGDPARHPALVVHNERPCNAEVPPQLQMASYLTPDEIWFVRHHHPVPRIDAESYQLRVAVLEPGQSGASSKAKEELKLSLGTLKAHFPKTEIVSTIQCGGNRRAGLDAVEKTAGIAWGTGAISNAKWGGVVRE